MANEVEKGLEAKAVELIDQLTEGLKGVAPQMADVTLVAIRFQGVMDLISCIAFTSVTAGGAYAAYRVFRGVVLKMPNEEGHPGEWTMQKIMATMAMAFAGVVCVSVSMANLAGLFSWQMWAAVVDPRFAIALRVINKLM